MKTSLTLAIPGLVLAASTALALPEALAPLDTSGDGMLGLEELQAVFPDLSGDAFLPMDAKGDGLLDTDEATAAAMSGLLPEIES